MIAVSHAKQLRGMLVVRNIGIVEEMHGYKSICFMAGALFYEKW